MVHRHDADVIIVGAGIVGSALALAIAQNAPTLHLMLVESSPQPPQWQQDRFDERVVALSEASITLLQKLQVWSSLQALRVCPYRGMEVWDGEGNGRIRFDCADLHREQLGFIVENSAALSALHQALTQQPNVQWLRPCKLEHWQQTETGHTLITHDERELHAPLLLAADGALSQLRQWAQLTTREWDYGHHAIVATVKTSKAHNLIARQRFSQLGPLAFLPLTSLPSDKDGHYSSIVWSLLPDVADAMMALDDTAFCQRLAYTFEHSLGEVEWADARKCFPLRQRHVTDYGKPGFAVLGDAAHTIHPLAGQGVNLGLYDANVLASEVVRAHQRQVPLDHPSIIKRFQRARKPHNLLAMSSMEGFKRLFGSGDPRVMLARNLGLGWVNQSIWLKRRLMQLAAGV